MNLMQETGAAAILKNGIFTSPQAKDFLQNLHAITHCPAIGKRTKVMIAFIHLATIRSQAWELMPR